VTVTGADVHPGYAKNKMVNATRVLSAFVMALPQHRTPETTEGREGFLHPTSITGNPSEAKAQFIVRSFTEEGLHELEDLLRDTAAFMEKRYPGARVAVEIKESYRNMKYKLDAEPRAEACADEAIRRAGLTPEKLPVRGGTDGSRLSFMGLPTPNLFNGSMNFRKKEWVRSSGWRSRWRRSFTSWVGSRGRGLGVGLDRRRPADSPNSLPIQHHNFAYFAGSSPCLAPSAADSSAMRFSFTSVRNPIDCADPTMIW
jgi:hypothetical protein